VLLTVPLYSARSCHVRNSYGWPLVAFGSVWV
jgi:hypothetical protein